MAVIKIRRIPPLPIALAIGIMHAVLGLLFGIINTIRLDSLQNFLTEWAGLQGKTIPSLPAFGKTWFLAYPIGGFIIGFLGTLIVAYLYNLIAKQAPIYVELK